jgi:glycosyltransferase involved in cell wall biosynthesis
MKILSINKNLVGGGAARIAHSIGQGLRDDCTLSFLTSDYSANTSDHQVPLIAGLPALCNFLLNTNINLPSSAFLFQQKYFLEADLVHCHNLHGRYLNLAALIAISTAKPLVWTLHDEWAITAHSASALQNSLSSDGFYQDPNLSQLKELLFHQESGLNYAKSRIYLRELYKYLFYNRQKSITFKNKIYNSAKINVVVPSLWLMNRVKKSALGQQSIQLIYNGVDTDLFTRVSQDLARSKLNLPKDKTIVFFLAESGKDAFYKGWNYAKLILDKYAHSDDIIFLCAGNKFSKQEGNVYFLPTLDQQSLILYYSASNLFLYPSLADNCPLVILEAMSCGLPVLSFATGGIPELVTNNENGFIAEYQNDHSLLQGFDRWLELSSSTKEKISNLNQARVRDRFSSKYMAQNYQNLYQDLCSIN